MDVIPALTEMAKSGQQGRMKMDKITRYMGVVLAFIQAFTMVYVFFDKSYGILSGAGVSTYLYVATVLTAGTMFLLWVGDQISTKGIGNGVSIIIFAGIVANIPFQFIQVFNTLVDTTNNTAMFNGILTFMLYVLMYLLIIVLVVFMQLATRKIPVQYTSSSMTKGRNDMTYLPLKINSASVIPVIFASAIMTAPLTIMSFFEANSFTTTLNNILSLQKPLGLCIYAVLIVLFTFFYTNLQVGTGEDCRKSRQVRNVYSWHPPGYRNQGVLIQVLNRITVLGAIFLVFIALLPYVLPMVTSLPSSVSMGGTGIIIVVGVAMETMSQLKGQLTQQIVPRFYSK